MHKALSYRTIASSRSLLHVSRARPQRGEDGIFNEYLNATAPTGRTEKEKRTRSDLQNGSVYHISTMADGRGGGGGGGYDYDDMMMFDHMR